MRLNLLVPAALIALAALVPGASAQEKLPPNSKLTKVEARPAAVALKTPFDYSQLLLTGTTAAGEQIDVTRMAKLAAPSSLVSVSPNGLVRPAADGTGELQFAVEGATVKVPVSVAGLKDKDRYPVSF